MKITTYNANIVKPLIYPRFQKILREHHSYIRKFLKKRGYTYKEIGAFFELHGIKTKRLQRTDRPPKNKRKNN